MQGRIQLLLGISLLAAQFAGIVYSRFVPERYFCWAPYDVRTVYTIEARVKGHALSEPQIQARYRKPKDGRDNRSPHNVIDVIRRVEQKRRREGPAEVVLRYRVNGKAEQTWRWPGR